MTRRHAWLVVGFFLAALGGCTSNPVGRLCDLGTQGSAESTEVVVASPSLDCISRTCLKIPLTVDTLPSGSSYPTGNSGLCTQECSSDDECERAGGSPCKTGFTCGIAVTVGPFCCKKFCQCKDYMTVEEIAGLNKKAACDTTNSANTCKNLPGR